MKGAEKIFIHGEEIARAKDVAQSKQEVLNILFQEDANTRNELNSRIDSIPVFYPQELVDNGFDYSYEDTTQLSSVTVEVLPYGSGAGFTLQEDGYYHADNVGVDQSYAMAKIIFRNESDTVQQARLEIQQVAEQGCDFFVKSFLNTDLEDGINDSMNVEETFSTEGSAWRTGVYNIPVGENYTIIKYRKDSSVNAEGELARFKASPAHPIITERKHMATTEGVEEQIKEAVSTVYKYKGSVADEASLPTTNNEVGDVYNCEDTGNNFAWDGTKWDKLAGTVDMSNYYTKEQSDARAAAIADEKIAAIPGGSSNPTVYYLNRADYAKDAPEVLTVAQEIYNQITSGNKDVVLVFKTKINGYYETNLCYYNESASSETSIQFVGTFSIPEPSTKKEKNGYTQIALYRMIATIYATDGVVTQVSNSHNWADMAKVVAISNTTQQAYMATKPWHPVSKQYADNVSKVVKQVDALPEREWITWDNTSDLSGKTIKISEGLHNYNMMSYDPESTDQYKTLLTSNTGYSIAVDAYNRDDEYRCSWVLLKDGSPIQTIAHISEYEYEDYIVENNVLPAGVGVFTNDVLGTSEMPDAIIYLGGFPQDFIYQVGTELHISIGESFVKLVTA